MGVTLRQLEIFVAVARECHFGRAAEALHISQPVVSQEIRRLERAVGAPLFDRSTRTVTLTELGSALVEEAGEVHRAARNFADRATRLSGERRCRLRIAVTPSVMDQLLPAVLRRAEADIPDAALEEVAVQTGEVAEALLGGGCDVGIGRFVAPPPGHTAEIIRSEPVLVALSSNHPLAGSDAVNLADLGDLPLLLWARTQNPAYYDHLVSICADRGLEPAVLCSPPLIVGGRSYLIADGRAFSLVPESAAARFTAGITVLPLSRPAAVPLSMVWRAGDPRPAVRDLLAVIRAVSSQSEA